MPFLFQMIGGRSVPWIAQVRTALRPTVTVETLICWSSARLSCTTSVGIKSTKGNEWCWRKSRDAREANKRWEEKKRFRKNEEMEKGGGKKDGRENHKLERVCWCSGTVAKLNTFLNIHLITSGPRRINSCPGVKDIQYEKRPRVRGHTASQISFFSLREIYVHWNGRPIQFTFTAN